MFILPRHGSRMLSVLHCSLVAILLCLGGEVLQVSSAVAQSVQPSTVVIPAPRLVEGIKRLTANFVKDKGTPGVSVSVLIKGQQTPLTVSAGDACVEHNVHMGTQDIFRMGSVTKVFTGLRIHMLIADGKLAMTTPLGRFYPDFPYGDQITIAQLLAHSSGIRDMLSLPEVRDNMAKPWVPQELIDKVKALPLDFVPGSQQEYSNTNYLLLGQIITKITGESYFHQIQTYVGAPLGMVGLSAASDHAVTRKASCGYSLTEQGQLVKPMMASIEYPVGTGNLQGRTEDIVRLVNQGVILDRNLIDSPPTQHAVLASGASAAKPEVYKSFAYSQSYLDGMTYFTIADPEMQLVGKSGMFPGFATWFLYDPKTRLAVAVSVNQEKKCMDAFILAIDIFKLQRDLTAEASEINAE